MMRRVCRLLVLMAMIAPFITGVSRVSAQEFPPPLTERFDLPGAHRILGLSPDGTAMAAIADRGDSLCTYAVPGGDQIACTDLVAVGINLREDDVAWAPDSRAIAFAENALTRFVDGDLWLMEAATGDLTNLTDDGYEGDLPFLGLDQLEQPIYADVLPTWSPDGATIAFSRAVFAPELAEPTSELWLLEIATGDASQLAVIADDEIGAVYTSMAWSPDGGTIYASVNQGESDNPDDGIWAYDAATGEGEQIIGPLPNTENSVPAVLSVSPLGDLMTVYDPFLASSAATAVSGYGLLSLEDGAYTPIEPPDDLTTADSGVISSPSIAPDGRTLLYNLRRFEEPLGLLIARDLATGEDQPLFTLPAGEIPFPIDRGLPITIAPNGLIFIPTEFTAGYLATIPAAYQDVGDQGAPAATPDEPAGAPQSGVLQPFAPADAARILAYSPDGSMVVGTPGLAPTALCTYAVPSGEEIACANLEEGPGGQEGRIRLEITDISWSPDSSTVAFAERPFLDYLDGDLWIMDAATGELTNVTDDGYEGKLPFFDDLDLDDPISVDVIPRWSPDSSMLAFSRTVVTGSDDPTPSELWVLDVASGESRRVAQVAEEGMGILYYNLAWAPDGVTVYVSLFHYQNAIDPDNGIWAFDIETGEGEQIVGVTELFDGAAPAVMAVSPGHDYLSIYYPAFIGQFGLQEGGYALFDLERGEIVELPVPESLASDVPVLTLLPGFTPDGASVVFGIRRFESPAGVIARLDLATGEADVVAELPDDDVPIPSSLFEGIRTSSGGTAFVLISINAGYLVPVPNGATGDVTSTPVGTVADSGLATIGADETALYAAPSFDAPTVLTLDAGAKVEIIGEPVTNDEGVWIPVRDPDTRTIGYVPEDATSPRTGDTG